MFCEYIIIFFVKDYDKLLTYMGVVYVPKEEEDYIDYAYRTIYKYYKDSSVDIEDIQISLTDSGDNIYEFPTDKDFSNLFILQTEANK